MITTQKAFFHFRASFAILAVFTVLLGGVYPLVVAVFAKIISANSENLIGQNFDDPKYFWGRLSANNYNAMNSGGTNFSPNNPQILDDANARISALQKADPQNSAKIPVELITASASGLDPHISLQAADYQVERVAMARNISVEEVADLVNKNIDSQSKIFGNPYVNVLELNLALDKLGK